MSAASVVVSAGDLELGLVPELGGSVAHLHLRQDKACIDLLRPLSGADHAAGDILGVAMFPMVPYANCIEDNTFVFDGRPYHVEPNLPHYKFNFHGRGWRLPWTVVTTASNSASLSLIDDEPGEPHRYRAVQHFMLEPDRLTVTTAITNIGPYRMPFGFGQHPWFPRRRETLIKFAAHRFWIESVDSSATEPITIPQELDFAVSRPPPAVRRNNCYGRWSGTAEVAWPEYGVGLRMTAEPILGNLMVYFPAEPSEVFCLEPQTNLVSAFTRTSTATGLSDLGVIILEPGQSAEGAIVFAPFRT